MVNNGVVELEREINVATNQRICKTDADHIESRVCKNKNRRWL